MGSYLHPNMVKKEYYAEFEKLFNTLLGIMNLPPKQPPLLYSKKISSFALFAPSKILFVLKKKKNSQQEVILSANDFFLPTKIFSTVTKWKSKDAVEKIWRPTIQSFARRQLLCSLTTILRRVISVSREHDQLKFLWARTIRKVRGVESGGGWFLACKNFFLAVCLCKKGAIIFRLIATLCRNYFSAKFASSTITVVCMVRKHDGQQSER